MQVRCSLADNLPFELTDRLRLKSIKLVGFKSFVDPTTVPFPSNLVGVVGPNGCGKSNIIDAVRWVMGESSAKNLRAEAGTDVIFNGSTDRKPVGQASVELIFDNPNGAIGGQYASYTEISIRRIINRDAQSSYFLNGTRCRRRDITDIFLGTGLGPRSYSIIEQGMISKLVEARPEELRVYLEEAAGISKYKERRRETETRIRHTQDNLDRLQDLRDELLKQLERLKRQSESAIKYKEWQSLENNYRLQLLALRWQQLNKKLAELQTQINSVDLAHEAAITEQGNAEAIIEALRDEHNNKTETWQTAQQRFYGIGGQVTQLEQRLQHIHERIAQLEQDKQQAHTTLTQNQQHLSEDHIRIEQINTLLADLHPQIALLSESFTESQDALAEVEQQVQIWQAQWDEFNQAATKASQQAQIEQTRIQHFEKDSQHYKDRIAKLQDELQLIQDQTPTNELDLLQEQTAQAQLEQDDARLQLQLIEDKIEHTRHQLLQQQQQLTDLHNQQSKLEGRKASLEVLQQAALGKGNQVMTQWLEQHELQNKPRLAESITVQSGWEKAVETVLGQSLQAVCVNDIASVATWFQSLSQGSLMLFANQPQASTSSTLSSTLLLTKLSSEFNLQALFADIYVAEDLNQALQLLPQLSAQASVITPEGIWLSPQWIRVARDEEKSGVLQRQQELEQLQIQISTIETNIQESEQQLCLTREILQDTEHLKEKQQQQFAQLSSRISMLQADMKIQQNRLEQQEQRKQRLTQEISDLEKSETEAKQKLLDARNIWQTALTTMEEDAKIRDKMQTERELNRHTLEQAKARFQQDNTALHQLQVKEQMLTTELTAKQQVLSRLEQQILTMQERYEYLCQHLIETTQPIDQLSEQLETALEQRLIADEALQQAKRELEEVDFAIRQQEQRRQQADMQVVQLRTNLEQMRLTYQGEQVRQQTLVEQLTAFNAQVEEVLNTLPPEATESAWETELQQLQQRMQRLGPINLAAIEEYATESERCQYLEKQHTDLVDALQLLQDAIQKIDKETRTKFKDTFEIVNLAFQTLFPKIFGGGSAYLELTSDNLLETGVSVMARPPGKKNSTIHLLSGGEKALTAIALVFSIFQLNPAPFCMLDEVDAPLDDANVGRYCHLIKDMSKSVQFIFVSHNKVTMEMAEHLAGVTMKEPGVSRLVSVNIEEAIEFAEA